MKVNTSHLKKLEDRSKPMIFVGYEPGSKAYRAYDPVARRVHVSRDVMFDEVAQWNWNGELGAPDDTDFVIEYTSVFQPGTMPVTHADAGELASPITGGSSQAAPSPVTPCRTPVVRAAASEVEFVSPPPGGEDDLNADHDDAPLRHRRLDDLLGPATPPGLAVRDVQEELMMVSSEEPTSFAQAAKEEAWRRAMLDEIASIEENRTWRLVDLPAGHRPIGLKWVFKLKKDAQGVVVKHKARLVAKRYVQCARVDFDEVFTPVAQLDSVRLLLALAAQEGWMAHHMDVKSAFLNGELTEEVYVVQPPGFEVEGAEDKVYRLDKAMYGLRQAPRAWNTKLDATLKKIGFEQSPLEHGLYARGTGRGRLLVGVYVDDLVIVGGDEDTITVFKRQMMEEFKMSDLGSLSFYLGIQVHQEGGVITLNQAAYAAQIVEKARLEGCNPCSTPMEPRLKLSKESMASLVDATEYKSLVGSLRYLVNSRPDLAFAVGYVSRFMEKPTVEHMVAVKRIVRYVAGTIQFGCRYMRGGEGKLHGYSDSDMARDLDTRKSTTGVLFFLGNNPVRWQSQK